MTMLYVDWKKVLQWSLHYWYVYVLVIGLCGLGGLVWYVYQPKVYKADATLMLRSNESTNATPQGRMLQMMGYTADKTAQDEIEILQSRNLMEQVIAALDIQTVYYKKDRYYREQYPLRDVTATIAEGDSLKDVTLYLTVKKNGYKVKLQTGLFKKETMTVSSLDEPIALMGYKGTIKANVPLEAGAQYKIVKEQMPQVVKHLRKSLALNRLSRNSAIMKMSLQGTCPEKSVAILNTLINRYNYQTASDNSMISIQAQTFLNARIRVLEQELDSMDTAIENYKKEHRMADLNNTATMYQENSEEYQRQLSEVEGQQQILRLLKQFINEEQNADKLIPGQLGVTDEVLADQIAQYNDLQTKRIRIAYSATENNPVLVQLKDQADRQREGIKMIVGNVEASLQIKHDNLAASQARYNQQLAAVPEQERRYKEMERSRATTEGIYMELCKQRETNTMGMQTMIVPARVVDYAQQDPLPIAPRLRYIGILCFLLGGMIALCGIAFLKRKDIFSEPKKA